MCIRKVCDCVFALPYKKPIKFSVGTSIANRRQLKNYKMETLISSRTYTTNKFCNNHNCTNCPNKSELFKLLSFSELETINQSRHEVTYKPGEVILKQGNIADYIVFLHSGLAKIILEGKDGFNLNIGYIKPTNILDVPGSYIDGRNHFSLIAVEETEVCLINAYVFKEIVRKNPILSEKILKNVSYKSANYFEKLLSLTQKNMLGRIAEALLYLNFKVYSETANIISATRKDLAELTAMSYDSVGKVLKDLEKNNILGLNGNDITILNVDKLLEYNEKC